MKLTVEHTEVFENLDTGTITDVFHCDGRGFIWNLAGRPFEFDQFALKLVRRADGTPEALLLEADHLSPDQRLELQAVLPPIEGLAPDRPVNLLLRLQEALFDRYVRPAGSADLPGLLTLATAEGLPVVLSLQHYDVADLAEAMD